MPMPPCLAVTVRDAATGVDDQSLDRLFDAFQQWAEHSPENFENRAALVAAEIARLEGREVDAEHLYEAAIQSARDNEFIQNEALANELAARFYAGRGFETIARAYLREARSAYRRWGADGKVRQLDERYPRLSEADPRVDPTRTVETTVEQLDLAVVLQVLGAISGETDLEKFITGLPDLATDTTPFSTPQPAMGGHDKSE